MEDAEEKVEPAAKKAKTAKGKAKPAPKAKAEPKAKAAPKTKAAKAAPPASKKEQASAGPSKRVVDRSCPQKGSMEIYQNFTVKLNQTNIGGGKNNNKFYIIQLLSNGSSFLLWTRWGRVGEVH